MLIIASINVLAALGRCQLLLQDGQLVTFSEVVGMTELNNHKPVRIKNCKVPAMRSIPRLYITAHAMDLLSKGAAALRVSKGSLDSSFVLASAARS